jgi:hypothetical protein
MVVERQQQREWWWRLDRAGLPGLVWFFSLELGARATCENPGSE